MKLTTEKIAQLCGVSRGTVDRALNNRGEINPDTKKRILEVASELDYRPNLLASNLSTGKTMTIGVVVFNLKNEFFSHLINNIEMYSRKLGYFVYITLTNKDSETEKNCIEHLLSRRVDGIVLCSINTEKTYNFESIPIPMVTVGNKINNSIPYVGINDYESQKEAVKYVTAKGYENIIFVCPSLQYVGKTNVYASEERYRGFRAGIKEVGIDDTHYKVISDNKYCEYIKDLNIKNSKTVIMCTSDIYAIKIINTLREQGISVPNDVGVIGFDNIQMSQNLCPHLTTIEYPLDDAASMIVKNLVSLMDGSSVNLNNTIPHKIIEGGTLKSH